MSITTDQGPVLDQKVWDAWIAKSLLREKATARRVETAGGIVLILIIFSIAFYRMATI